MTLLSTLTYEVPKVHLKDVNYQITCAGELLKVVIFLG